jgi:hypothetical protein
MGAVMNENEKNRRANYKKRGYTTRKKEKSAPNRRLYCIFKRDKNGILMSCEEHSFSMGWSYTHAAWFNEPPTKSKKDSMFRPQDGCFIIVRGRKYDGIEFTGNKIHHGNMEWINIEDKNVPVTTRTNCQKVD